MLHRVHQLVANFVCLLFGPELIVYSGLLELLFSLKTAGMLMRAVSLNQLLSPGAYKGNKGTECTGPSCEEAPTKILK